MQNREQINRVAKLYGIEPNFIEPYGLAYKLFSKSGQYALKKMDAKNGIDFLHHIQLLYQKGYNRIVPIFPAIDGRYAVLDGNSLFYMMPWLENQAREGQASKDTELFRELARMHSLSANEVTITTDERKEYYDLTIARWEKELESLEAFVEECERQVYMSPFQLHYCLYYHEIAMGQKYAIDKFKEWYESTKEETKVRRVIMHGKLSPEHFLYNEKGFGYFANFEKAAPASPMHDILPYIARHLRSFPQPFDDGIEWLSTYFRYFPYKEDEMKLFLSYLALPSPVFSVAEAYFSAGRNKNEWKFVRKLERKYWYMKNTEYVVMRLEEKLRADQSEQETPPSS